MCQKGLWVDREGKKNFEKRPEVGMGVVMSPTHTQNHTLMSMHTHCVFTLEKWFLNCLMRKVGPLS